MTTLAESRALNLNLQVEENFTFIIHTCKLFHILVMIVHCLR